MQWCINPRHITRLLRDLPHFQSLMLIPYPVAPEDDLLILVGLSGDWITGVQSALGFRMASEDRMESFVILHSHCD